MMPDPRETWQDYAKRMVLAFGWQLGITLVHSNQDAIFNMLKTAAANTIEELSRAITIFHNALQLPGQMLEAVSNKIEEGHINTRLLLSSTRMNHPSSSPPTEEVPKDDDANESLWLLFVQPATEIERIRRNNRKWDADRARELMDNARTVQEKKDTEMRNAAAKFQHDTRFISAVNTSDVRPTASMHALDQPHRLNITLDYCPDLERVVTGARRILGTMPIEPGRTMLAMDALRECSIELLHKFCPPVNGSDAPRFVDTNEVEYRELSEEDRIAQMAMKDGKAPFRQSYETRRAYSERMLHGIAKIQTDARNAEQERQTEEFYKRRRDAEARQAASPSLARRKTRRLKKEPLPPLHVGNASSERPVYEAMQKAMPGMLHLSSINVTPSHTLESSVHAMFGPENANISTCIIQQTELIVNTTLGYGQATSVNTSTHSAAILSSTVAVLLCATALTKLITNKRVLLAIFAYVKQCTQTLFSLALKINLLVGLTVGLNACNAYYFPVSTGAGIAVGASSRIASAYAGNAMTRRQLRVAVFCAIGLSSKYYVPLLDRTVNGAVGALHAEGWSAQFVGYILGVLPTAGVIQASVLAAATAALVVSNLQRTTQSDNDVLDEMHHVIDGEPTGEIYARRLEDWSENMHSDAHRRGTHKRSNKKNRRHNSTQTNAKRGSSTHIDSGPEAVQTSLPMSSLSFHVLRALAMSV